MSLDVAGPVELVDPTSGEVVAVDPDAPDLSGWSARGLKLREGMSYERYRQTGRAIAAYAESVHWALADWLNYGEEHFPDAHVQAASEIGVRPHTLQNLKWVGKAFPPSRRRERLSVGHHQEVAGIKDLAEQESLLDEAERRDADHPMPRQELRVRVQERKLERGERLDVSAKAAAWADQGRLILALHGKGAGILPRDYGDTDALAVLVQRLQQAGGGVRGA